MRQWIGLAFALWAAAAVQAQGVQAPAEGFLVRLANSRMAVEFDRRTGALYSLREAKGRFETNYFGNPTTYPGTDFDNPAWTGHMVSTTWELSLPERPIVLIPSFSFRPSGRWRQETTANSADIRRVAFDGSSFTVRYTGASKNEGGIRSYDLSLAYRLAPDQSLVLEIDIVNTTGRLLEIGELGFPMTLNDNYSSVREKSPYTNEVDDYEVLYEDERLKVGEQKTIHEERVTGHHFVAGHSSYSLIQRLLGDPPFLLVHPTGDTFYECIYRQEDAGGRGGRRGRANVLAMHSLAVKNSRGWRTPWVNGHSSLLLKPGERKRFGLRFAFIDGYPGIRREIAGQGNLGLRVIPSMVAPENTPVFVEVQSRHEPALEFLSDNIVVRERKRVGDRTLLTFTFRGRGQKSVKLTYDGGKWTNLHFYCVEDLESLIKARSRFIVERQFYDNPEDPYNRHHMFLPFDHQLGSTFRDSDNVWEVGGNDEYGFSEPLFLAEKNVYYPDKTEIATLETYVEDCLRKHIQDQDTFALRASLYWKERTPSSPWGHWTEARSKETYRTYNYPHAANIYHALYRIGRRYGLTTRQTPLEYLRLAARTGVKWFRTGPWRHVGVMGGPNALNILADLKAEGLSAEHAELLKEVETCNRVFVDTPYPYSSELFVDQTAHEHVYFFTRHFGHAEKASKTLQVIQALRGGGQPVWFRYGNDNRGDMAGWYTTALNSRPLLAAYEDTGDIELLLKGYAGIMAVTANLLPDGMGFGHYVSTPGVQAFDPPRTLDNGIGMYGFFKAAKSYVFRDESFGFIGAGCDVQAEGSKVTATLRDGLKKRLRFVDSRIDVEAEKGEILRATSDASGRSLALEMADSTSLAEAARIVIAGLAPGRYSVSYGTRTETRTVDNTLVLEWPLREAKGVRIRW
ncbi:MAG: hypothetical protein H6Q05_4010 [Acidobacteria bacterium]|nr:hypothetical protein [Acidobacteriota bacterium]